MGGWSVRKAPPTSKKKRKHSRANKALAAIGRALYGRRKENPRAGAASVGAVEPLPSPLRKRLNMACARHLIRRPCNVNSVNPAAGPLGGKKTGDLPGLTPASFKGALTVHFANQGGEGSETKKKPSKLPRAGPASVRSR